MEKNGSLTEVNKKKMEEIGSMGERSGNNTEKTVKKVEKAVKEVEVKTKHGYKAFFDSILQYNSLQY